jgi:hypothetical protein
MADAKREEEEDVVPTYDSEHVKCAHFVKAVLLSVCDSFEVLEDEDPDYEKGNLLSKAFITHRPRLAVQLVEGFKTVALFSGACNVVRGCVTQVRRMQKGARVSDTELLVAMVECTKVLGYKVYSEADLDTMVAKLNGWEPVDGDDGTRVWKKQ